MDLHPANPELSSGLDGLLTRRVLIFLGKGGVGKSTVTAALGQLLAARGRRVLLCEVNAHDRLPALLGVRPVGAAEDLYLCNLRPEPSLHEYALMKLHSERVVRRLLDNRWVHHFLHLLPSLSEVVMLGKLLHHVREQEGDRPRFDAVLLDAPATGHGISLLRLPQILLGIVPPGPLRDDMAWMNALLLDPAVTQANLVTLPEELPVTETLELNAKLRDALHLPRGLCFANGVWPENLGRVEIAPLAAVTPALFEVASRLAGLGEISRSQLDRLGGGIDLPILELPQVFDTSDPQGLALALGERIAAHLPPAGTRARRGVPGERASP